MNSWQHSQSACREWGGVPEVYQEINEFIDSSKQVLGDVRHRSMYHHTMGVYLCQRIFGDTIIVPRMTTGGPGKLVPVRLIAERHIIEDLGFLPTPADYIRDMPIAQWMSGSVRRQVPLSHLLGEAADA